MRIYDISPTDGTVIDHSGREAPLDPMRQEPRIPAGATSIEPPATGANEAARWAGEDWEVVPDWRGHAYWLADGSRHDITELGVEPPNDALDQEPPKPISDIAARKREEITASLSYSLSEGMPYTMPDGTEDTVQMLAEDRQNLLGLAMEAERLKAAGVTDAAQEFRGLSNKRYPMTPDEVIAMTDAALSHYKALLKQSWDRKDAIDAALEAGDRKAIEAVDW